MADQYSEFQVFSNFHEFCYGLNNNVRGSAWKNKIV